MTTYFLTLFWFLMSVLLRALALGGGAVAGWLASKNILTPEQGVSLQNIINVGGTIAGALVWEWFIRTKVYAWAQSMKGPKLPDPPENPVGKINVNLWPFIGVCMLGLLLAGCTGSISILTPPGTNANGILIAPEDTPRQTYYKLRRDYKLLSVANVGVSLSHVSPAADTAMRKARERFLERLNAAAIYLNEHPEIQNVPGAVVPQLDLVQIALGELQKYEALLGPMPPDLVPQVPATQGK